MRSKTDSPALITARDLEPGDVILAGNEGKFRLDVVLIADDWVFLRRCND